MTPVSRLPRILFLLLSPAALALTAGCGTGSKNAIEPPPSLDDAVSLVSAAGPDEKKDVSASPPPEVPPARPAPLPALETRKPLEPLLSRKPLTSECEKLFQEIQALDQAIPTTFAALKRPAEDILRDIETLIERGRRFVKECPDTAPSSEVKAAFARVLLAKSARHRQDLEGSGLKGAKLKEKHVHYLQDALKLGEAAVREAPLDSPVHAKALQVVADIHDRLGQEDFARHKEHFARLRTTADVLLKEHPDYKERPHVVLTVADSLLLERRYEEAVKYLDDVIKAHPNDPQYVLYNDKLFDALTGVGDLERMEDLMSILQEEYPAIIEKADEGLLKAQCEHWLCIADFWHGFIRLAFGDNQGAREHLKEHAEKAGMTLKAKEDGGRNISNDPCNITLQFRTLALLDFIDNFAGKPPKVDFDLLWATEEKVTLKENKGKVVAALFRLPGDRRAETFLQELDALSKKLEKEGLVALTVGFLSGTPNDAAKEKALQSMRDDLRVLGVSLPAGYDPDSHQRSIFRALHATVGTATFVAFNQKGEIAWLLADPRDMDRKILERVLRRLLEEKD
ncbi:MAG TPA: hypothetical protein VMT52_17465 [Planctomycetota bacterium]|nr:hypothetical protein [Planctomycetota bacterium]